MHNHTGKTKTAMLLELESIKGLLIEEDGIPILQEVIAEEIPILDMIVPPEELPEEAIPLLVSVVVDEEVLGEQPPEPQPQFATQEDTLSWSESFIETGVSLDTEVAPEAEIPSASAISLEKDTSLKLAEPGETAAPQAQPSIVLASMPDTDTSSWDAPELFLGKIPTLIEAEPAVKSEAAVEIEQALAIVDHSEDSSEAKIEKLAEENTEENIAALAIDTPPETPQHRTEQQQDFFQTSEDIASERLPTPAPINRPTPIKTAGENPFLPEHIRARLQGNSAEAEARDIHSKRFKALSLGSIHSPSHTANKPSPIQQQLINEVMDKMLPEMARELRGRLEQMSRKMLEELLAER